MGELPMVPRIKWYKQCQVAMLACILWKARLLLLTWRQQNQPSNAWIIQWRYKQEQSEQGTTNPFLLGRQLHIKKSILLRCTQLQCEPTCKLLVSFHFGVLLHLLVARWSFPASHWTEHYLNIHVDIVTLLLYQPNHFLSEHSGFQWDTERNQTSYLNLPLNSAVNGAAALLTEFEQTT